MAKRYLSDQDRAALPPDIDPEVFEELLDHIPPESQRMIIDVVINPQASLGISAEMFASRLGSDDPTLKAIIDRLYRY